MIYKTFSLNSGSVGNIEVIREAHRTAAIAAWLESLFYMQESLGLNPGRTSPAVVTPT